MKAKSVLSHDAPRALEDQLNRIDEELMTVVLTPHLKVNPQEFVWGERFVQQCDFSVRPSKVVETENICIATLTMVSGPNGNWNRSNNAFPKARMAMVRLWSEKLGAFMPVGHKTRLSVVIVLDESIPQSNSIGGTFSSSLVEGPAVWIPGEADPKTCPIYVGQRSKRAD